ncbi:MAG TPA: AMP-binding protein [Candidatus Binatia bacterium]|jgi:fatty-acyl-CoA synthase
MERITIGDGFDRVARGTPDREAFAFPRQEVRWTFRGALGRVQRLAKALIGLGVERGDHVALWATSRPEWVLVQLAAAKIGAVLVPVSTAYGAAELGYALEQSDATTLFTLDRIGDVDCLALLAECCPEMPGARPGRIASRRLPLLKRVALLDDRRAPGVLSWSEVLAASAGITDHMLRRRQETVAPDDPATVVYTSGTTGPPRGAEFTHLSLVNTAHYAGECMRLSARDSLCVPVPLHDPLGHVLGTLVSAVRGLTMVVPAETFDAGATLQAVAQERCTALHGTPAMFTAMLAQPRLLDLDVSSLRTGILQATAGAGGVLQQVAGRTRCRELTVAYGRTEGSSVITQTRAEDPLEVRLASAGRPLPHVEVRIIDPTGRELGRGEEGELCCRGYVVMRGYYKMPEATAQAIDGAGWLHTGDLATMDEHGYCRITGRVSDVVVRAGERVDAREVRALLASHPKVRDAQVFGVPDSLFGEEVAAWIRLREGETATIEEMRDYCRARLAASKVPRHVRFVDRYPTTPAGTVQTFRLREITVAR